MASILYEEVIFFENITVERENKHFIIQEWLFIKYNLKDEAKEKNNSASEAERAISKKEIKRELHIKLYFWIIT
jgi:hypothetical protein